MKGAGLLFAGALILALLVWFSRDLLDPEEAPTAAPAPQAEAFGSLPPPSGKSPSAASQNAAQTPVEATPLDQIAAQCRRILSMKKLEERYAGFRKLIGNTYDPAALKQIISTMEALGKEGFPLREEWGYLWYVLAGRDAIAAMKLADGFGKDHKWYGTALDAAMSTWAEKDSTAAMNWLNGREDIDGALFESAMLSLVRGLTEVDVDRATAFVMQNFNPKKSGSAQYAVTSAILRQRGVPGLHQWFSTLPDDAARNRWFPSVANRLSEADKELQRQWMMEQASKPWRNDRAYVDMFMGWSDVDPQAAMNFAMQLPPDANGNYTGTGTSAYGWLVKDAPGFAQFYQQLPQGPVKAGILKALKLGVADPDMPNRKNAPARAFLQSIGELPAP